MKAPGRNLFIQALLPWMPKTFRRGKNPYVFVLCWALIGIMLVYAVLEPYENDCFYPLLYAGALLGLMVAVTWGLAIHLAIHLATFMGLLLVFYGVAQTGGVYSPHMTWSLVLPLTPFFVISRRAGQAWLLVTLCAQLAVGLMTQAGWFFHRAELTDSHAFASLITYVVLSLFLMAVPVLYDLMSRDALSATQRYHEALVQKRLELEHISKMREQFISTISHELRTPMNAIMGFTALLTAHFQSDPGVLKVLKHSQHSAEHLMTVINDILDYSQLHAGGLSAYPENFELREAVRYAFELFSLRLEDGSVEYACDIADDVPQWVLTDRHRLMQILVNLLGNAIKFTQKGQVRLRVRQGDKGILFLVEDTGIGIADAQKANIFQRYSQADETIQNRFGGHGLGLSISRRLVELLGGEMGFESTLHVGSTFWFCLPLQEQGPPKPSGNSPRQPAIHSANRAWRFLVVDDHHVNRLLVKQVLMHTWPQCEVLEAHDGAQALGVLEAGPVDLVFMDMLMPVMDGIEATRAIRARYPASRGPFIIGLTANVNLADLDVFRVAGLDELVLKPFQASALTAVVDNLLHPPVA